ncbi:MAG: DNA-3-methyladenine glycosylase [Akkermansiaceae bacterium]|nr:DNA-3-methyladenine glycosylase [Armatimonadota bacterium]
MRRVRDGDHEGVLRRDKGGFLFSAIRKRVQQPVFLTEPPFTVLERSFYEAPTLAVARDLLGQLVVRRFADGEIAVGRIAETEAYTVGDPACHAFRGKSRANAAMWGPPGKAYVHINYGLHYCLNAVTAPDGVPEAVLIRAIEPVQGAARLLRNYTGQEDVTESSACSDKRIGAGPGRLTRAMAITKPDFDGHDLTDAGSALFLARGEKVNDGAVTTTTRIGITKGADYPWRFYITASRWVSRR